MLATQCSKPQRTKSMMGMNRPQNLPVTSLAAKEIHTAMHTRKLQQMPRMKASPKLRPTLPAAVLTMAAARPLEKRLAVCP